MAVSSPFVVCPKLETTLSNHRNPAPLGLIGIRSLRRMNNRTRRCLIQSELSASRLWSSFGLLLLTAIQHLKDGYFMFERKSNPLDHLICGGDCFPVEICEKLAIPQAEWLQAIAELRGLNHIEEAAVLSTCNRIEVYVLALSRHRGVKEVTEWMSKKSGIPVPEIRQHRFLLYNKDATQHLFEVSAGLDSLVLGEGQILAQVKQVVSVVGQGDNGFGRIIKGIFYQAISAGKLPESSSPQSSARMLVIGAGNMGKLVIKHFVAKGYTKMVVVNRSKEKVAAIREDVEIIYKPLDEMLACAAEANVIFTSTASETPLFLKEHVKLLHGPMQHLRCDGSDGRTLSEMLENMRAMNIMYELDAELIEEKIRAKV